MAKYLNEAVNRYGNNKNTYGYDEFYTGISIVMVLNTVCIRLNGPTSTTKQIEISQRFAGINGMIIQLDIHKSVGIKFFDCSWISKFWEKDERLFISGTHSIEIVSVINIKTAQNFKRYIF